MKNKGSGHLQTMLFAIKNHIKTFQHVGLGGPWYNPLIPKYQQDIPVVHHHDGQSPFDILDLQAKPIRKSRNPKL